MEIRGTLYAGILCSRLVCAARPYVRKWFSYVLRKAMGYEDITEHVIIEISNRVRLPYVKLFALNGAALMRFHAEEMEETLNTSTVGSLNAHENNLLTMARMVIRFDPCRNQNP